MMTMVAKRWRLRCPDCGTDLTVDTRSGTIVSHRRRGPDSARKSLEGLVAEMEAEESHSAERFAQEMAAQGERERLLDERFDEALKRADDDPDDAPPPRPFDFD